MRLSVKQISNLLFAVAFVGALLMLTDRTYGYRTLIQSIFYLTGACALILSLVASRMDSYKDDFNVLFWIGSLIVFIGLILKTYYLPFHTYVTIGGMGISALSFFVNPFQSKRDTDDELLDQ